MSSTALVDPPPEATRVAGRHRRTERLVGAGVAVLVGGVAVAALLVSSWRSRSRCSRDSS